MDYNEPEYQNQLPDHQFRLRIDTFDPVPPTLVAELIQALSSDMQSLGFAELELVRAGRGSVEIEMMARETAKYNLEAAKQNKTTAQIRRDTAGILRDVAVIGGIVAAIGLLAEGIKAGENESSPVVAAVMVAGNGAQCTLSAGTEIHSIRRGSMHINEDKVRRLLTENNQTLLRFSPKLLSDLLIKSKDVTAEIEIEVENIGRDRAEFLQGQQLIYVDEVEEEIIDEFTEQAYDDPEIGPSIDVGFVERSHHLVGSMDTYILFPEEERLPDDGNLRLLLYFTYQNAKTRQFSAQILIYELRYRESGEPVRVTHDRPTAVPMKSVELVRAANLNLKY